MRLPFSELIACDECDALHWQMPLGRQARARCTRCGATLYQSLTKYGIQRLLAITLTSGILFIMANSLPMVELKTKGFSSQTMLIGSIAQLWVQKMPLVAVLAFCATILCPFIELAGLIYLLILLRTGRKMPDFSSLGLLRAIQIAQSWAMIEVLMLGALVTFVKLSSVAHVIPGPALFALGGLTFSFAVINADLRRLSRVIEIKAAFKTSSKKALFNNYHNYHHGHHDHHEQVLERKSGVNPGQAISARCAGLVACRSCGHIHYPASTHRARCRCCGSAIYSRKPNSLSCTWSLLATATMFIVPANLLPIMHRQSVFGSKDDTIISGVIYFWTSGSWALALIVFVASLLVPVLKLAALGLLAFTVQFGSVGGSAGQSLRHAKLYRLIESIGRWSMLDIFVVMFTVVLVQFRPMVAITVGPGSLAFGLVVVLTMLASMQFDSRLIWDHHACTIR